jgi:hypothetical protein
LTRRSLTPTTSQAASASGGFDWAEGLVGSLALFATILVIGSAIVIAQRRQEGRPLGV